MGAGIVDKLQAEPDIDLNVTWLPFELHPGTPDEGLDIAEYFGRDPESIQQSHQGLKKRAAEFDLPMEPPMRLSNSHHALLLTEYARDQNRIDELVPVLFRANFVDGQNLADPDVLRNAATEAGLDPDAAMAALNSSEYEERIRKALIEGQRSGITGVPGFIIDGRYRIVGAIPYEQMAAALRQIQHAPA